MGANQRLRQRTVWLLIIVLVFGFGAVISRLAYLQLIAGEDLQQKAVQQQLSDTTISAKRGTIYDRNGKILAQSASVWQVVLSPANFETDEQRIYVANRLAEILGLEQEDVLEQTKQNSYYSVVKRKIESEEQKQILELMNDVEDKFGLSSVIALLDDYKRYYPYSELASSVIGFTGSDDQGLSGVEYQYDEYLTGTPGRLVTATNANGTIMPFDYSQNVDAVDGNSVVLTIDETIQSIIEKYMKQAIRDYEVYNRGVCIAMDVKNGEILGMATVGGYDPNDPFTISKEDSKKISEIDADYLIEKGYLEEGSNATDKEIDELIATAKSEAESAALSQMWRNKAISDTYYPGSVFKMITLSMALEEGTVNKDTRFNCTGYFQLYEEQIGCHNTAGHGTQNYAQALCNSCNPAFIQIGQSFGEAKFWEYYQAFGFADKTGIDLPGESDDLFFSEDGSMGPVDLAVASFGQNFSITPIQMITAASAIANGGDLVQPHVVKQILGSDGSVVHNISTDTKRQVISSSVAAVHRPTGHRYLHFLPVLLPDACGNPDLLRGGGLRRGAQGHRPRRCADPPERHPGDEHRHPRADRLRQRRGRRAEGRHLPRRPGVHRHNHNGRGKILRKTAGPSRKMVPLDFCLQRPHFSFFHSETASSSQRLFLGLEAWPLTQW